MAQRSGFFTALQTGDEYDRVYTSADYCDNLATVIKTGVRYSADNDLVVSAGNNMYITVGIGRAWIKGRWYHNDTPLTTLAVPTAPVGSNSRIDRVILRLNTSIGTRSIVATIKQGTAAANPVAPTLTRSGDVYEIGLATIRVKPGVTAITAADITDTRADGNVCGWAASVTPAIMSMLKQYIWTTTISAATRTVEFAIAQYDPEDVHVLDVYTNGILETLGVDYTISGKTITFAGSKQIGTEIKVILYKSIDGTGLETVADEITKLQNDVAAIKGDSDFVYVCNGATDNVKLSNIAQEWLTGGDDYASKKIRVVGTFGVSAAYGGTGTAENPFRWLSIGADTNRNRRIVFDFSSCGQINIPVTGETYNNIFHGMNAHVIGANVIANNTATGTVVKMFSSTSGAVRAEHCRFWITAHRDSVIAHAGTFVNCRGSVANAINNAYCFLPYTESMLRIENGEYYAYTGESTKQSAVIGQSAANAVSVLYAVNAPTVSRSGFYQTNSVIQYVGGGLLSCTDLISTLPVTVTSGISNVRGTLAKNKPGLM